MPRSPASDRRKAALDRSLRSMFQRLEDRPIPVSLIDLVDQLEAADAAPLKRAV